MAKMFYYAITTLSTIGFGDFSPKSTTEKLLGAVILMLGVAVFSIIMNKLMSIIVDFRSIDKVGNHRDLSKWIAMLSKFNGGQPLSKEIISRIEDFFEYYWTNNRLVAMQSEIDLRFLSELPDTITQKIYIEYLFKDFLYMFKNIFRVRTKTGLQFIDYTQFKIRIHL